MIPKPFSESLRPSYFHYLQVWPAFVLLRWYDLTLGHIKTYTMPELSLLIQNKRKVSHCVVICSPCYFLRPWSLNGLQTSSVMTWGGFFIADPEKKIIQCAHWLAIPIFNMYPLSLHWSVCSWWASQFLYHRWLCCASEHKYLFQVHEIKAQGYRL